MTIKFAFVALIAMAFVFSFVSYASGQDYRAYINPINPVDGAIFEINSGANLDINFNFEIVNEIEGYNFTRWDFSWNLEVSGEGSSYSLDINWINDTYASAAGTFPTGDYQWQVTGTQPINNESSLVTFTDSRYFSIREQPIVVSGSPASPVAIAPTQASGTPTTTASPTPVEQPNSGNNGGSGGNGNGGGSGNEGNGGRLNRSLLFNELNTPNNSTESGEDSDSKTSWITGAATGLFGKDKNAKIMGIVLIVVGIVGLLIYTRKRWTPVKSE